MAIHFNVITTELEFKSSRYKMMMRFTRALVNIIQVASMISNWAMKKYLYGAPESVL